MENKEKALTIKDVAEFLNISTQMVYILVKSGKLKAFKIGSATRILYSDLINFIKEQKKVFTNPIHELFDDEDTFLSIKNLNLQKEDFFLKNISLSLPKAKTLALYGTIGSGKTLLLHAVAGLEDIDSGEISLGIERIDNLMHNKRKIGYVFLDNTFFPHQKKGKNIEKASNNEEKISAQEEISDILKEMNIDPVHLDLHPSKLSESIKQLIAIGKEKSNDFDLLLLDEPLKQLDQKLHGEMLIIMKKIIRDLGKTIIISFANLNDALSISDYIAVMSEGCILQTGRTQDVYNKPSSAAVMDILSHLGINKIKIEVKYGETIPFGLPVEIQDGFYNMCFRLEEIEISDRGIPVEIVESRFYDGSRQLSTCRVDDGLEIRLLLPINTEKNILFLPKKPFFFSYIEDKEEILEPVLG